VIQYLKATMFCTQLSALHVSQALSLEIHIQIHISVGARYSVVVKTLCYEQGGRGFEAYELNDFF
jgi:hypothetical protein